MFLKKLDMLSPPITLFYKGENSHPSVFSGILTIVAYGIIVAFGIYYFYTFITRASPTAFFFNRYVEDAGEYPVNASSMFNFIQVLETTSNKPRKIEFDAVRVIGLEETIDNYAPYKEESSNVDGIKREITDYDHWLYSYCNNDSDTKGLGYLINQDKYLESACIRYYYKKDDKKYYATNEKGFQWPDILRGCSHPNRTFYGIIMEKCVQDAASTKLGVTCKSDTYINEYIRSSSVNYLIIDHYADVLNYEQPFTKYFYSITNGLFLNSYTTNHLNFNPAIMNTHNGIFFDNLVETRGYFFDQNEKVTESEIVNGVIVAFYFWMQNRMQYYERNYDRLQDTLGDIGGIASIVMIVAEIINFLVSEYVILRDTEELILNSDEKNYRQCQSTTNTLKPNINRRPTIYRKANEFMNPPKRNIIVKNKKNQENKVKKEKKENNLYNYYNYIQNTSGRKEASNYIRLTKDGTDSCQNTATVARDEKTEQYKQLFLRRNNMYNNYLYAQQSSNNSNNYIQYMKQNNNMRRVRFKKRNNVRKNSVASSERKEEDKPMHKIDMNFCTYIGFVICCHRNNPGMKYYEDFRGDMISEENLIQCQLDIYKLLKIVEGDKCASENT